ncbi:APC family permease [Erythrobacter donghaensis]|uniref:APC family permease n=1 Tax=Erythrobacter donghaensis TaxID=267135 RepID=UPI000A3895CF|nr:APC family permease [Erythrobacter donghaensis]
MSKGPATPPSGGLQKRLGLPFAIAIMAGSVIGAGILRTPGVVANEVPVMWAALAVWALGGAYVLLSVNVASELTTALPRAGGIYVPVREAFGDSMGLLAGWAIWVGYAAGGAALALAFAEFLAFAVPAASEWTAVIAVIALLAVTLFNWLGVEEGRIATITALFIKLALLCGIVVAAFVVEMPAAPAAASPREALSAGEAAIGWVAFVTALQIVLGAYDGWQGPAFFAEEDKDPARNIPRAFFTSALLLLVVYLGINLCVFTVIDLASLRSADLPVALVIEALLGPTGMKVTGLAAATMALLTLNALVMTHPRILYGMARDGLFLKSAMLVNGGGTPWVALLIGTAVPIPMILTGAYVFVFKIQVATGVFAAILYNASYFALRLKRPHMKRPFRAIGHPVLPGLILGITMALFAAVVIADPVSGLWVAGLIGVSIPVGLHLSREQRSAAAAIAS